MRRPWGLLLPAWGTRMTEPLRWQKSMKAVQWLDMSSTKLHDVHVDRAAGSYAPGSMIALKALPPPHHCPESVQFLNQPSVYRASGGGRKSPEEKWKKQPRKRGGHVEMLMISAQPSTVVLQYWREMPPERQNQGRPGLNTCGFCIVEAVGHTKPLTSINTTRRGPDILPCVPRAASGHGHPMAARTPNCRRGVVRFSGTVRLKSDMTPSNKQGNICMMLPSSFGSPVSEKPDPRGRLV